MRSVFKKLVIGAGAFGAASYGTAFYMFPEIRKDQHQLMQATERIMRLSWTGAKMAYTYGLVSILNSFLLCERNQPQCMRSMKKLLNICMMPF